MKMNEPIGDVEYGPMIARLGLGAYFVLTGLKKLDNIQLFLEGVRSFKAFPDHLATLYGILVPYLEIGSGVLLVLGIWTTLGAIVSSILLCSYIFLVGLFPADAGGIFNKDVVILCASLSLLFTGAGSFSVDRFRKTG